MTGEGRGEERGWGKGNRGERERRRKKQGKKWKKRGRIKEGKRE